MNLTRYEQETIITYNEEEKTARTARHSCASWNSSARQGRTSASWRE